MGCSSSKNQESVLEPLVSGPNTVTQGAVAVERAAQAQSEILLSPPAASKVQEAAAEEAAAQKTWSQNVKVHVFGARGLRKGDLFGNSELFVEASIFPGKPGSIATTAVVASHEDDEAAQEGACRLHNLLHSAIRADFDEELEVKGYSLGDIVMFLVKDKDRLKDDFLGQCVLTEEQLRSGFEGELALIDAGSGHQAFLRVKVDAQEDPIIDDCVVLCCC